MPQTEFNVVQHSSTLNRVDDFPVAEVSSLRCVVKDSELDSELARIVLCHFPSMECLRPNCEWDNTPGHGSEGMKSISWSGLKLRGEQYGLQS